MAPRGRAAQNQQPRLRAERIHQELGLSYRLEHVEEMAGRDRGPDVGRDRQNSISDGGIALPRRQTGTNPKVGQPLTKTEIGSHILFSSLTSDFRLPTSESSG